MNRADDEHPWLARQSLHQVAFAICLNDACAVGIQRGARRSNDDWINVVHIAQAFVSRKHTMLTGRQSAYQHCGLFLLPGRNQPRPAIRASLEALHEHLDRSTAGQPYVPGLCIGVAEVQDGRFTARNHILRSTDDCTFDTATRHRSFERAICGDEPPVSTTVANATFRPASSQASAVLRTSAGSCILACHVVPHVTQSSTLY